MLLRRPPTRRDGVKRSGRPALLLLLALTVLPAANCGPGDGSVPDIPEDTPEITVAWTVTPDPPRVGPVQVSLTLTEEGQPVAGAEVRLEGNMSHPGMAPVFSGAREAAPGRYEAPLDLTMAGDWFVLARITLRDGRSLSRTSQLPGVRPRG